MPSVVPKIANPRNHQGADADASARGFISKLELGSKCTRHSGAGTWTPKWVTAGFFIGWSRGFSEGMEEFLKFCLHFDMGLSRALSSVLILIGASCPWLGLSFYCNVGLSRTLSCKLLLLPVTEVMLISAVLHRDLGWLDLC